MTVRSFSASCRYGDGPLLKHRRKVVITLALRTPMCKARKGGYKDMHQDELLTAFFKVLLKRILRW